MKMEDETTKSTSEEEDSEISGTKPCNKSARKSPLSQVDAEVGKDIQPCNDEVPPTPADQLSMENPWSYPGMPYQRHVTSSVCSVSGGHGGKSLFYVPPPLDTHNRIGEVNSDTVSDLGGKYSSMMAVVPMSSLLTPLDGPSSSGMQFDLSKGKNVYRDICDCSNCAKAQKQFLPWPYLRKNKIHNCHFPGCGKEYLFPSELKFHLLKHTGERPFVCKWPSCKKTYSRKYDLNRHQESHTSKNYACNFCSKRFACYEELSNHEKMHIGKKTGSISSSRSDSEKSQ